ncbi:MAG: hypothetical protein ACRD9W_09240 [Terriglobia bacterium]
MRTDSRCPLTARRTGRAAIAATDAGLVVLRHLLSETWQIQIPSPWWQMVAGEVALTAPNSPRR